MQCTILCAAKSTAPVTIKMLQEYAKEKANVEQFRSVYFKCNSVLQLVNGPYLDIDYYDERKEKVRALFDKANESQSTKKLLEESKAQVKDAVEQAEGRFEKQEEDIMQIQNTEQKPEFDRNSIKWYVFMICKYLLILLRFIFTY